MNSPHSRCTLPRGRGHACLPVDIAGSNPAVSSAVPPFEALCACVRVRSSSEEGRLEVRPFVREKRRAASCGAVEVEVGLVT